MLVPFLTIYLKDELDLGAEFATQVMGAFGAGALIAAMYGGHLADRVGRRVVMLVSLFGGAAILMLFGSLRSPGALLTASAVFAFITEMYRPAASAMIGDLVEPKRRSHAFGLMYVSINLGFAVAPVIGGILTQYSFQWLFWGDALTCAVYGVIIAAAIRETLPLRQGHASGPATGGDAIDESETKPVGMSAAIAHILRDRTFLCFCAGTFLIATVFMQALSTFPLHLLDQGIGAATYGKIIAINGLMIVCFQLPTISFVNRFNRATMLVWGTVLMAVGFGLNELADVVWHFAMIVVIWTCGEMMSAPIMPAIVSDLSPIRLRGRYMGVFTMCHSAALMIGVPIGGVVLARLGSTYIWAGCFALALLGGLLFWTVRHDIGLIREEAAH